MTTDNYFNAAQAATHTGVSVVTIRSHLNKGSFPNAKKTLKGKIKVWAIPLADLVAAGLLDKISSASEEQTREAESLALQAENRALKMEVKYLLDMVARADVAIEEYRQDKARLNLTIETRDVQEQRRRSWFGRNK
jgi:uncharacterized protein YlxW (UPF0749 family)